MMIRKSDYTEHGGLDGRFCTYGGDRPLLAFECPGGQESDVPPLFGCLSCGWSIAEKDNPMKTYLNFRNNLLMIFKTYQGRHAGRHFWYGCFSIFLLMFTCCCKAISDALMLLSMLIGIFLR